MKKKITCFSPTNIQSIFAHSINFFKTSEGFSFNNLNVDIVCRDKFYPLGLKNLFAPIFNNKNINLVKMPYIKLFRRLNENEDFELQVQNYLKNNSTDFAYFRSYNGPNSTIKKNIPTIVESHAHPTNDNLYLNKMLKLTSEKNFKGLVTISNVLKDSFVSKNVPKNKIQILSDGFDEKIFFPLEKKTSKKKVVTYFGHLYKYKGVFTILETAKELKDISFKIIGGTRKDLNIVKKYITSNKLNNVYLYGHVKMDNLRKYLIDTDFFLLPPSLNHPSAYWTSPLKLCEYIALHRPVIVSDIPSLRHWLSEDQVYFFKADSPISLSKTIIEAFSDKNVSQEKINNSKKFLIGKSYKDRSKSILNKLQSN